MEHEPGGVARRDAPVPDDVARLLATVPEWFGRPAENAAYVEAARTAETWTVRNDDGAVVGVALVDRPGDDLAELHLLVVDRSAHGGGVGTALVAAVEADAAGRGVTRLQVKTLGPSHPDPAYARTRRFYRSVGFVPLAETDDWGAETPCLVMVKPVRRHVGATPTTASTGARRGPRPPR